MSSLLGLILLLSFGQLLKCNDSLYNIFKNEVEQLSTTFPDGYENLVFNIETFPEYRFDAIKGGELESRLRDNYHLNEQIIEKFKGMQFAKKLAFQTFSLVLNHMNSELEEVIGAARLKDDDYIQIIYYKVVSRGSLSQRYRTEIRRHCVNVIFWWDECFEIPVPVAIPFSTDEIMKIQQALRASGYQKIKEILNNSQLQFNMFIDGMEFDWNVDKNIPNLSPLPNIFLSSGEGGSGGVEQIGELVAKFQSLSTTVGQVAFAWEQICNNFKTTRSSTIKERLLGQGFSNFASNTQFQYVKGLKSQYIAQFLGRVAERVNLPTMKKDALVQVFEEVEWSDSTVWSSLETLFSVGTGGNAKSVNFWVNKNEVEEKYDILFTDINSQFKLAPDVLVIEKKLSVLGGIFEKEEIIRKEVPRGLTDDDLKAALQFSQIVSFKVFLDQFGISVEFPK